MGDKTEKVQQAQDFSYLESITGERLLGEKLVVLTLHGTSPWVPTYGTAAGEVPGWQEPASEPA